MTNTFPEWAVWVARDKYNLLCIYALKPEKEERGTWGYEGIGDEIEDSLFPQVKWSDPEPRLLADLLKEDEEKVNDKKWLKEEVAGLCVEISQGYPHDEMVEKEIVLSLINQLDEPQTEKVVIPDSKPDLINHPNHYQGRYGLEAIEVVRNFGTPEMLRGFYWGNAIKYMTRYRNKNGLEDLKKARKNLDWLIEELEE